MALRQILLAIHIFIVHGQDACETATADLAKPVHSPTVDAEHLLLQAKIKSAKVAVENTDTISAFRNSVGEDGSDHQPDPLQKSPDYPSEFSEEDEEGSISFATDSSKSHSSQPQEDPGYPNELSEEETAEEAPTEDEEDEGPVSLATDSSKSQSYHRRRRTCGHEVKRKCFDVSPWGYTGEEKYAMKAKNEVSDDVWDNCDMVEKTCPKFRFGTKGSKSGCPDDYRKIVHKDECKKALAALGGSDCLDYMGGKHGASGMVGCTRNTNNNCWHFNVENTKPDASESSYTMHSQSNYVCVDGARSCIHVAGTPCWSE